MMQWYHIAMAILNLLFAVLVFVLFYWYRNRITYIVPILLYNTKDLLLNLATSEVTLGSTTEIGIGVVKWLLVWLFVAATISHTLNIFLSCSTSDSRVNCIRWIEYAFTWPFIFSILNIFVGAVTASTHIAGMMSAPALAFMGWANEIIGGKNPAVYVSFTSTILLFLSLFIIIGYELYCRFVDTSSMPIWILAMVIGIAIIAVMMGGVHAASLFIGGTYDWYDMGLDILNLFARSYLTAIILWAFVFN